MGIFYPFGCQGVRKNRIMHPKCQPFTSVQYTAIDWSHKNGSPVLTRKGEQNIVSIKNHNFLKTLKLAGTLA